MDLLKDLQTLFPAFGDAELLADVESGDAGLHAIMRHFAGYFGASGAVLEKRRLVAFGRFLDQAVAEGGELDNAVRFSADQGKNARLGANACLCASGIGWIATQILKERPWCPGCDHCSAILP
ncbi:MAG: hypothetical protein ACRECY_19295 [Phyllobacterium sp.]